MGGGHRRANPRRGEKGPLRGDRRREEVAGRKRIDREYREKGPSHVPITKPAILEEFDAIDYRILYAAERRKAYGYERSMDLGQQLDIQRVPLDNRERFVEAFTGKLRTRGWGDVYEGPDGRYFIYIKEEAIFDVRRYLDTFEP
jgi:hypothetical protein